MTVVPTISPSRCAAFALDRERRSSRQTLSPPSTTCLENFSLPGLLTVTSHFDLLNSSDANSVIGLMRAVVATTVAEVTGCIGCLHAGVWKLSLPSQATVHPHRIFFRALQGLAVDDGGRGRRSALLVFAQIHVQSLPDRIPNAVLLKIAEDVVDGRARRESVARKIAPRTTGAQQIEDGVERHAHIRLARTPARLGRRDQRLQTRPLIIRDVAGIAAADPHVGLSMLLGPHSESPLHPDDSENHAILACARRFWVRL